jgi:Resolvase, N terminal domain/helix-turn-helix, Psq domain
VTAKFVLLFLCFDFGWNAELSYATRWNTPAHCLPHTDGRHSSSSATFTPAGKAMFQMLGVFAEFERSIIQERVRAGLQRARREGKRLGRPPIADKLAERIRAALAGGMSVRKTAAKFDVNPSTVQRVAHPFEGADNASVAGAA